MVNIYNPCYTPEGQTAGPAYCIGTNNVKYTGPNLPNTGIETNNNVTVALQKIDEALDPVELVQNIIIAINQNPSLQVMFCALVNSCGITPTTTTTSSSTSTSTTTTTTTAALYSVDINVTELTNTDLTIKLWYSTNGGSTWTFYLSSTAGYPNYNTFTGLQFPAGTNVLFGITDNSDVNIEYGSGLFSGDFNSLCGLTNPFVINNISTATTLYANLNVSGGTFVPCPTPPTTTTTTSTSTSTTTTTTTVAPLPYEYYFELVDLTNPPNLGGGSMTLNSFGGGATFTTSYSLMLGTNTYNPVNTTVTADSGKRIQKIDKIAYDGSTVLYTVNPRSSSYVFASGFFDMTSAGTGAGQFQSIKVYFEAIPVTTTTTTTVAPPTYMFPLGTSILFPANACTGPILNYLWSYNPVFGAGNIYYAGTPSGPTIPLQVQNGQNDYYSNGSVVVQIDNSGLSYNQAPCASPTTTTSSTSTSTTTTTTTFFNPSGTLDTSFNIGTGFDSFVYATSIDSSGRTVAGGLFTSYNGSTQNRLARINSNGSIDTSFNVGTGFNNTVNATAIDSNGKILVGGEYTTYNSSTQNRLVRLNSDGTKDNSFNVGTGFDATVWALAVDSNGKILVGGNFTSYNGSAQNYLIRLNSDGTKDTSFDIGTGFVGFTGGSIGLVTEIVIDSNGKILIGGNFTSYRSSGSSYLIRLNSDGTVDTSFNTGSSFDSWVVSIKIDSSGKIVAGGNFELFQGLSQNKIVRLNSDGSKDTSFNIGIGFGLGLVYSLDIDSSGKVLVGSNISTYQGVSQPYLVRINSDGSRDTTFNTGIGPNSVVFTTNIDSVGRYIIGGFFTLYNGTSQNFIARLI